MTMKTKFHLKFLVHYPDFAPLFSFFVWYDEKLGRSSSHFLRYLAHIFRLPYVLTYLSTQLCLGLASRF